MFWKRKQKKWKLPTLAEASTSWEEAFGPTFTQKSGPTFADMSMSPPLPTNGLSLISWPPPMTDAGPSGHSTTTKGTPAPSGCSCITCQEQGVVEDYEEELGNVIDLLVRALPEDYRAKMCPTDDPMKYCYTMKVALVMSYNDSCGHGGEEQARQWYSKALELSF